MKTPAYRYRAFCHRVIDGDTYELDIDLGFKVSTILPIRLRGVDTPEMDTKAGKKAKEFVEEILLPKQPAYPADLIIETYKDRQTFARYVADVWLVDGADGYTKGCRLADVLIGEGQAKVLDIP